MTEAVDTCDDIVDLPKMRLANPGDEGVLMDMVHLLHKERGLRDQNNDPFELDVEKYREVVYSATSPDKMLNPWPIWIGMVNFAGDLAGSVALQIMEPWYSRRQFVGEVWNFVLPEYRKTGAGKMLINFSKGVADSLGLQLVMGVMSTERQPAKMRFYERSVGVQPLGGFFLYHPKAKS